MNPASDAGVKGVDHPDDFNWIGRVSYRYPDECLLQRTGSTLSATWS